MTGAARPVLSCRGLTVTRSGRNILDRVDLELKCGEVLAIVGPNGAGKSTLLACLAGGLRPTSGEVCAGARRLSRVPAADLARRRGVLSQRTRIPFELTALEVVLLGRVPHRGRRVEPGGGGDDADLARRTLDRVGAGAFADRTMHRLSGGEQQRVHLARVLVQAGTDAAPTRSDRALLLDEPTSALDPRHARHVLGIVREEAAAGAAVGVVLHDLNLAAEYADRIVVMQNGQRRAHGTPSAVFTAARLEAVYGLPAVVVSHPTAGCPLVLFSTDPDRSTDPDLSTDPDTSTDPDLSTDHDGEDLRSEEILRDRSH